MKNSFVPLANANNKKWYVIDAKGKTLGRVSTLIATILIGKHKTIYNPALNCGDYIIVINVQDIKVSGKKAIQKKYQRHSGRPGSLKIETFEKLQERIPEKIFRNCSKRYVTKRSFRSKNFQKFKSLQRRITSPYIAKSSIINIKIILW
jgi:large subunit ribosomal protein L13